MLLTNYDFYDIYWSIVLMHSDASAYDYAVSKAIKDTIDADQADNIVEFNKIRNALSDIKALEVYKKWNWVFTQNIYTYGIKVIKDIFAYQILSAMFEELLTCLKEPDEARINDLKIAMHNIPIILADENKHIKTRIVREIKCYRRKWNHCFLKNAMKK